MDARSEYQEQLDNMLGVVENVLLPHQELWLKMSPDLDEVGVTEIISVAQSHRIVVGYTATNTTTNHPTHYITYKLKEGGASGNAVYDASFHIQKALEKGTAKDIQIIACGGINSLERAKERTAGSKVKGIQIYTPIIFSGPKLLRELRG